MDHTRVVSSETIETNGQRLGASLNTLEFEALPNGARVKVTIQAVSFCGPGMIEGYESGNRSALENLAHHLARTSA